MSTKKKSETIVSSLSELSYEEYCSVLLLAKKIRTEQAEAIKKATDPKSKIQLLEQLFQIYQIPDSQTNDPSKAKEISVLVKTNIFIPNNKQFLDDYKTRCNKNIRIISEEYQIPAPFAISKIAELGRYEKYLKQLEQNPLPLKPAKKAESNVQIKPVLPQKSEEPKKSNIQKPAQQKPEDSKKTEPDPVTIELTDHLHSMEKYCQKLLGNNEQLAQENTNLSEFTKKLKQQIEVLNRQIEQLQKTNYSLMKQVGESGTTFQADDEKALRIEMKELELENHELQTTIAEQKKLLEEYRSRTTVAETLVELLRGRTNGIMQSVDEITAEPRKRAR